MAKTGAERQAAYRARRLKCDDADKLRLDLLLDVRAKYALERLAVRYRVTPAKVLEKLIKTAEGNLVQGLSLDEQRKGMVQK